MAARLEQVQLLSEFKALAISQLAAQHEEILHLRELLARSADIRALSPAANRTTPHRSRG